MDEAAAPQAAVAVVEEEVNPRRDAQQVRWKALRAAHPGVEMEYDATPAGRMTRGRLGPGQEWSPWRRNRDRVLRDLEEAAKGDAAAQAASGMPGEGSSEAVRQALEALRLAWGDVYTFGHDEKGYWAARHHRPGTEVLRAETPEELGELLAADFEAEPS